MSGATCARCGAAFADPRFAEGPCPRCLLTDDASDVDAPLEIVGGVYRIDGVLGRGGMGVVFAAHDLRLARDVALKLPPPEATGDAERRRRFVREARLLSRLEHPGVVRVYDVGEDGDRPYFVAERVRPPARFADAGAADLGAILRRYGPAAFAPAEAAALAAEVADALDAAHRAGFVHRDVKPSNVLLDRDGRAKLADFGVAALLRRDDAGGTTAPGAVPGTPGYLAPEVLAGAAPHAAQDVFALGATLYELLTGRPPLGAWAPPPPPWGAVVARALAPDPAARWTTAADFAAALRAAVAGAAVAPSAAPTRDAEDFDLAAWTRSASLALTGATAVVIYALKTSLTPKTLPPGADDPLVMIVRERLADGSVRTAARFETWPMLGAVVALAAASAAYALLVRHWRRGGLRNADPATPLPQSRGVLVAGAVSVAVWLALQALLFAGLDGAAQYAPICGGLVLLWLVYRAWTAALEARRRSRPLRREPAFWLGVVAGVAPACVEFLRAV